MFSIVLCLADGIIIGSALAALLNAIMGNSPFARLIRLIASWAAGLGYFLLCGTVCNSFTVSMWVFIPIAFGPIAILLILLVLKYMYK